jgi:hypothetical protein
MKGLQEKKYKNKKNVKVYFTGGYAGLIRF